MIRRDIEPQPGCVIALVALAVLIISAAIMHATHEAVALVAVGLLALFAIYLIA